MRDLWLKRSPKTANGMLHSTLHAARPSPT